MKQGKDPRMRGSETFWRMKTMLKRIIPVVAMIAVAPLTAQAQMKMAQATEVTATVEAIDHTNRIVTLKGPEGVVELGVGPEVKRFNELKVGDKITFTYVESVLAEIQKSTATGAAPAGEPKVTRGTGAKPSGMVTQTQKATVTIEAIDANVPSVKVKSADGHSLSFKVQDKTKLAGLKVGDKVDITYTEALMVSVK
jgi:Cu/Ag efflux protein CusF